MVNVIAKALRVEIRDKLGKFDSEQSLGLIRVQEGILVIRAAVSGAFAPILTMVVNYAASLP